MYILLGCTLNLTQPTKSLINARELVLDSPKEYQGYTINSSDRANYVRPVMIVICDRTNQDFSFILDQLTLGIFWNYSSKILLSMSNK